MLLVFAVGFGAVNHKAVDVSSINLLICTTFIFQKPYRVMLRLPVISPLARSISEDMNSEKIKPLYTSKPSARSLWQEYRVYQDRLELKFWLFLRTLNIPASKIVDIRVVPSAFQRKKNT